MGKAQHMLVVHSGSTGGAFRIDWWHWAEKAERIPRGLLGLGMAFLFFFGFIPST